MTQGHMIFGILGAEVKSKRWKKWQIVSTISVKFLSRMGNGFNHKGVAPPTQRFASPFFRRLFFAQSGPRLTGEDFVETPAFAHKST